MLKVFLLAVSFASVTAYAGGSVYVYHGLYYENEANCSKALSTIVRKIELSQLGHPAALEGYCQGDSRPVVSFVSDFEQDVLGWKFKPSVRLHDSGNLTLKESDAFALMEKIVQNFESPDFYVLEVANQITASGADSPTVSTLDLKNVGEPYLYVGKQYSTADCAAKLAEIVQDLKAKFGKATGICANSTPALAKPLVFFVD